MEWFSLVIYSYKYLFPYIEYWINQIQAIVVFFEFLEFLLSLVLFLALVSPWLCIDALCPLLDVDWIAHIFRTWFALVVVMSFMTFQCQSLQEPLDIYVVSNCEMGLGYMLDF